MYPPSLSRILYLWFFACALACATYFLHPNPNYMGYDEGDYYLAVQRGFWANWTDRDNISLAEYLDVGLQAIQGKVSKAELSHFIRTRNSTMFLRHEHSPLSFYPAILLRPLLSDLPLHHQIRATNLFWMVCWITMLCSVFIIHRSLYTPWIVLLPASASYAMACMGFNMHIPFGLMLTAFLYLWYEYARGNRMPSLRILVIFFLATTLLSVAYGIFIAFFLFLWMVYRLVKTPEKKSLLKRWRRDMVWLILILLVLWPASLLTLNLPRSYVFQVYMALFRLPGYSTGFASFLDMLLWKWNASLLELGLAVGVVVVMLYHWKNLKQYGSYWVAIGFLACLAYFHLNLRFTLRWYLFPFFSIVLYYGLIVTLDSLGVSRTIRTSDRVAYASALTIFVISLFVIQIPVEPNLQRLHAIFQKSRTQQAVVPLSVYTHVKAYYPSFNFRRLHNTEFNTMTHIDDSLQLWRQRGIVIIPRSAARYVQTRPDDSTDYELIFFSSDESRE